MANRPKGAGNRDRNVRLASLAVAAIVAGPVGPELAARACSTSPLGIQQRTVWPGPSGVPTNARLFVSYQTAGYAANPPLGTDVVLLDGSSEVPIVPLSGNPAVVIPVSPLLPDHPYQLADRRTVPCLVSDGTCALSATAQPFSTFTTGPGADTTAPTFGGLQTISVGPRDRCDSSACCGPYDLYRVTLGWDAATDDAGGTVAYRVYRREGADLSLVAGRGASTTFSGVALCSGSVWAAWGNALPPGRYVVRAIDGAGNEDTNTVERLVGDPCIDGACAVAGHPSSWTDPRWLLLTGAVSLLGLAGRRRRPGA